MTHLVCSTCGYENWSWSALQVDPVALDFRAAHEGRGHQVVVKVERRKKVPFSP